MIYSTEQLVNIDFYQCCAETLRRPFLQAGGVPVLPSSFPVKAAKGYVEIKYEKKILIQIATFVNSASQLIYTKRN